MSLTMRRRDEKTDDVRVFHCDPARHLSICDPVVILSDPLGHFGTGTLNGEDALDIAEIQSPG